MNFNLHLWKEWLIFKRVYLPYVILLYILINFMVFRSSSLDIDPLQNNEIIFSNYIFRLLFIFIASVFMLMSMINQSIGAERLNGHIHTMLAYNIPISRIIIGKSFFIVLITSLEVIIMITIFFSKFWEQIYFSITHMFLFIFFLLSIFILVLFLSSLNIFFCYIFPKLSQVFSVLSFGSSFIILAYYKNIATFVIDYAILYIIFSISLIGFFEYILILIADRIPKNLIIKS